MNLTKEDFKQIELILDKKLDDKLDKKLTNTIIGSEKRIIETLTKRIDESQEELARMVKNGFDDVMEKLDVRDRVHKLEKDMTKIKTTLLIH